MNNQRTISIILAAIVAALVAFATTKYAISSSSSGTATPAEKSTAEKVIASGIIRCGYVPYPPGLIKDPTTGQISGMFPEILEEAAKNLGLKVEWTEEVGWGTMVEGLKTNRYDMVCQPVWPLAGRAKVADFSEPIYYSAVEAYVRADDSRLDGNLAALNNSQFRIATTDGELAEVIAQKDYPNAKRVGLPQLTDFSQLLLTVIDGKADAAFMEPHFAFEFMKKNPGKLKAASPGNPVRLSPNVWMIKQEDTVFRRMIDTSLSELQNNGFVEQVLRKHEPFPGAFYRNARPFQVVVPK